MLYLCKTISHNTLVYLPYSHEPPAHVTCGLRRFQRLEKTQSQRWMICAVIMLSLGPHYALRLGKGDLEEYIHGRLSALQVSSFVGDFQMLQTIITFAVPTRIIPHSLGHGS